MENSKYWISEDLGVFYNLDALGVLQTCKIEVLKKDFIVKDLVVSYQQQPVEKHSFNDAPDNRIFGIVFIPKHITCLAKEYQKPVARWLAAIGLVKDERNIDMLSMPKAFSVFEMNEHTLTIFAARFNLMKIE